MKSRISCFDKTALRKDITRFTPLWLIYFIGGTLVMFFLSAENKPHSLAGSLGSCLGGFCWINLIYAALAAQLLFGDLFNSRLCNALHAMPLRRETWFVTHFAAGVLFSLVPNAIGILVTLPWLGEFWFTAFLWLLGMELQYLFFFGLAVFCMMCAGSRIAMVTVYGILNFLALIVLWLATAIYEPLLYGVRFNTEQFSPFCPILQMTGHEYWVIDALDVGYAGDGGGKYDWYFAGFGAEWIYLAVTAVLGIGLGVLALVMYRRRKLESAGDFMAVAFLKPVFAVVYTLCMGALFSMVGEMFGTSFVVFLIVGLAVGWFTGQMLLQRTAKVFKGRVLLGFGALAVAILVSIGITKLDPLGVTRYVPKLQQVQEVTVNAGYTDITVTPQRADRLQQVLDIHKGIIETGEPESWEDSSRIAISYKLTDGRIVLREYDVSTGGSLQEDLRAFASAPESVLQYEDWDAFVSSITGVMVYIDGDYRTVGQSRWMQLLEAIKADCEAGTMAQGWRFHGSSSDREYTVVLYLPDTEGINHGWNLTVYADAVNTVKWIEENLG